LQQWVICIVIGFTVLIADEVIKFFLRRRHSGPAAEQAVATQVSPINMANTASVGVRK
jgi:hypothetical protein